MADTIATTCCIAGGGPAGLMLGLLLAGQGVRTTVLEKHADFLRDFRGDTIHPSTLQIMDQLGYLDEFLSLPHQEVTTLGAQFGETFFQVADFSRLSGRSPFLVIMPQWDFLDFLADRARRYSCFELRTNVEAKTLIREGTRVVGVLADTAQGPLEVRADLVVAADGRSSALRADSGLQMENLGAPMDVLWFRLSRRPTDSDETVGRFGRGSAMVRINRGDYWQCAFLIPKGGGEAVRQAGLEAFRARVAALGPVGDRVHELQSWDDIKLLTVTVDRLKDWHLPGFLCIGDAAHAMSPVGGVGVNLAVQDAVAAANLLGAALREHHVGVSDLKRVQHRRLLPTRIIQAGQVFVQDRLIAPVIGGTITPQAPWPVRLAARFPVLQAIPARIIGLGIRREKLRFRMNPPDLPQPS